MSLRKILIVGCGGIVRHYHLKEIFKHADRAAVVGIVEPGAASQEATRKAFAEAKHEVPPFFDRLEEALAAATGANTALVATPHKFHYEQTKACLEGGLDVFLEKPMVMNAEEARLLIRSRDASGKHLVVGFPGSLSGAVRKAKEMIAAGELGDVNAIAGSVHQHWKENTAGSWRQNEELSGGGFLFDTGSHMINTVVDLAGVPVAEVFAFLDNRGAPVEINSTVGGRFANGITFSILAAGDSIRCESEIFVYGTDAVLRTGIWGERLEIKKGKGTPFEPVEFAGQGSTWVQFLDVLDEKVPNACPPEVGLRFALLMDMIRLSGSTGRKATPEDITGAG